MLCKTKKHNEKIGIVQDKWKARRLEKLRCNTCKAGEIPTYRCHLCRDEEITSKDPEIHVKNENEIQDLQEKLARLARQYDCEICGEDLREKLEQDCDDCGQGIYMEDREMCLLGLDVVALFPSMKSKNTGLIIRKQVLKSPLKIKGFNWKQGARYIVVNKKYTGDLGCIWKILPYRRKVNGTAPGMKSKEINSKKGDIESQWAFPPSEPTEQQEREIVARVAEIGVRVLFENFTYKFAGDAYKQTSGEPIGARVTMAAARIVMDEWGERYKGMLETAKLEIGMLTGYVDDVRQGSTCLRMGTRFSAEEQRFIWNEDAKKEDLSRRKEMHESTNARMVRVCLPAINSINKDLEFTTEIPEEFPKSKLPTLDFLLWLEKSGLLNHSYFEKAMKTPYVIMSRSAMCDHQRYSILSNELVRRLSNINYHKIPIEEQIDIIENFTRQMKNSEYDRKHVREAVVSGVLGWKRKILRREKEGTPFYRSAKSTLRIRCKKKIMEKTTWYKSKRKREDDVDPHTAKRKCKEQAEDIPLEVGSRLDTTPPEVTVTGGKGGKSKNKLEKGDKRKIEHIAAEMEKIETKETTKAVMFVPFTSRHPRSSWASCMYGWMISTISCCTSPPSPAFLGG